MAIRHALKPFPVLAGTAALTTALSAGVLVDALAPPAVTTGPTVVASAATAPAWLEDYKTRLRAWVDAVLRNPWNAPPLPSPPPEATAALRDYAKRLQDWAAQVRRDPRQAPPPPAFPAVAQSQAQAGPAPAAPPQTAPAPPPPPPPAPAPGVAQQVVNLTNAQRTAGGCGPVSSNPQLTAAAQAHSADMAGRGYFQHRSLDGRDPGARITASGYAWRAYGENIAWGQPDPAAVVNAWMASPGHRANILNCRYLHIGVGYAVAGDGRKYWVQDFAQPR